jgi:protein arginine kinase
MSDFFTDFAARDPAWLDGNGPHSDIAISTRARLARNLATVPFPHHATDLELGTTLSDLSRRVGRLSVFADGWNLGFAGLAVGQRRALQEKLLATSELVGRPEQRGIVLSRDLSQVALINDEDHLRLLAFKAGFAPREALATVEALDDALESEMEAAFSPEWGYLTACPTDVGTGLRLSALLHLPGLALVGEIEKVLNALRQLQFAVRGPFGEGSAVRGALFQISNLITLGRDEQEITADFQAHVGKIITYERSARDQLYGRDALGLEDMVHRSRATLAGARIITAQEAFDCLSNVRLGLTLGILPAIAPGRLNQLMVHQQTAHLELVAGRPLAGRDKGAARAALLREFFADPSGNPG